MSYPLMGAIEKLDPELATRLSTSWFREIGGQQSDQAAHVTLSKLLYTKRWLSPFILANLNNLAEAVIQVNAKVLNRRFAVRDLDFALRRLDLNTSAGYPYWIPKGEALKQDFEAIASIHHNIVAGEWDLLPATPAWCVLKQEVLKASKKPQQFDDGLEPGKLRNIFPVALPVITAFNSVVGEQLDWQHSHWPEYHNKVGAGKFQLPMILKMLPQDRVYGSYDCTGLEMTMPRELYDYVARIRAHQSGLPVAWWKEFYRRFVWQSSVICTHGHVYSKDGGNVSGMPDTIDSNGEATAAVYWITLFAVDKNISPNSETVFNVAIWKDWISQKVPLAVVGDDLVASAVDQTQHERFALVASTFSSLIFKLEKVGPAVQQVFLSNQISTDILPGTAQTVRPDKLLAGLFWFVGEMEFARQAVASVALELRNTKHYPFMLRLMRSLQIDLAGSDEHISSFNEPIPQGRVCFFSRSNSPESGAQTGQGLVRPDKTKVLHMTNGGKKGKHSGPTKAQREAQSRRDKAAHQRMVRAAGRVPRDVRGPTLRGPPGGRFVIRGQRPAPGVSVPRIKRDGRVVTVSHREYLFDLPSSTTYSNIAINISPGTSDLFPWLSSIAVLFEKYRFKRLNFIFRSSSGTSVGSTNTALGIVVFACNYDPTEEPFTSKVVQEAYEGAVSCVPSSDLVYRCDVRRGQQGPDLYFVRGVGHSTGNDLRFTDIGLMNFAVAGQQTSSVPLGEVWADYEIELHQPRLPTVIGGSAPVGVFKTQPQSAVGARFNGLVADSRYGNNLGLEFSYSNNAITFGFPGRYRILYRAYAITSYTDAGSWNPLNALAVLPSLTDGLPNAMYAGSGTTSYYSSCIVDIIASGGKIHMSGGPVIAGACVAELEVYQIPGDTHTT